MAGMKVSKSVEQVVKEVIETIPAHGHLKLGKPIIICLERQGNWVHKGQTIYAKVYKADSKVRALSDIDFFLIVNGRLWELIDDATRIALIDHELCHIRWKVTDTGGYETDIDGRPIWTLVPHDLEDFAGVIQRHSLWTDAVRRFFQTAAQNEQLQLFSQEAAVTATPEDPAKQIEMIFEIQFDDFGRPIFIPKDRGING